MSAQQTTRGTATFVKQRNGHGDGRVYKVDPPIVYDTWGDEDDSGKDKPSTTEYVWVSAVVAYSGPETYIFAADEDGEVLDWGELKGSFRGGLDHVEALRDAGYEVSRS